MQIGIVAKKIGSAWMRFAFTNATVYSRDLLPEI